MDKKKRLIYIIHDFKTGGVETALLSAIPRLFEEFDVYILCIGRIDTTFISNIESEQKSRIRQIYFPLILLPIAILKTVYEAHQLHPDIIISSLWKSSWAGSILKWVKSKVLFISFIHSNKFHNFPDKLFTKMALKRCDAIFCDSHASATFIHNFVQNKPIFVISFLRYQTPLSVKQKTKLNLTAIFLGRLTEAKRIDRLLQLITQTNEVGVTFTLDIVGRGSEQQRQLFQKLAYNLGIYSQISFKNEVHPDLVFDLLSKYEFYIQTSDNEGMAMSVVEAMQQGLVPIVTHVGEIAHYTQNMENAIIVPRDLNKNKDDYLINIIEVASDVSLYNRLAQNANATFKGQHTYAEDLVFKLNACVKGIC